MKKYLISVYYSTMLLFGKRLAKSGNFTTNFVFFLAFLFFWNTIYGWSISLLNGGAKFTDSFDTLLLLCFVFLFFRLVLFRKEKYFETLQNSENKSTQIKKKKALLFYLVVLAFNISFFVISYLIRDYLIDLAS